MYNDRKIVTDGYRHLSFDELINESVSILTGVSEAGRLVLKDLKIETIFDLGMSRLFQSAHGLAELVRAQSGSAAQFSHIPFEWLDDDAEAYSPSELAHLPLSQLRGIDAPIAENLKLVFGISNILDIADWQPFVHARGIVRGSILGPSHDGDPEIPSELVPTFNEYSTEKYFYEVYVINSDSGDRELEDLEGPLDMARLDGDDSLRVRTGAIITYQQTWRPVGLALGNLLHSLALAPGESTRVALIDWSRRQGVKTSENISQQEQLINDQSRLRSLQEVAQAVAKEAQSGFSSQLSDTSVANQSLATYGLLNAEEALQATAAGAGVGLAAGAGVGLVAGAGIGSITGLGIGAGPGAAIGAGAGALIGLTGGAATGFFGSAQFGSTMDSSSNSLAEVSTTTASTGNRELSSSMAQNISDRTHQHSNSVRSKRATIVQEVWQQESEKLTTRAVTNYNHMHALTVQYFEVVQMYRMETKVSKLSRALYIPLKSIAWTEDNIKRYRSILVRAALDLRVALALSLPASSVVVQRAVGEELNSDALAVFNNRVDFSSNFDQVRRVTGQIGPTTALAPWILPRGVILEDYSVHVAPRSSVLHPPDDLPVIGSKTGNMSQGLPLVQVGNLEWAFPRVGDIRHNDDMPDSITYIVRLELSYRGQEFRVELPYRLRTSELSGFGEAKAFVIAHFQETPSADWLIDHLNMFSKHYSRSVWRSVDEMDVAHLLSGYRYEGQPVLDNIDRKPLAITGQYLLFAYHHESETGWKEWQSKHGFHCDKKRGSELLPMPTGGVFAEAIQGRANSAEMIDLRRFWNWQESPIPMMASDIAALQAGSRAMATDVRPGSLDDSLVDNLAVQGVPDPVGMSAITSALASSDVFRDMSGIVETAQLAQVALEQAQAGATSSGQQASEGLARGLDLTKSIATQIIKMNSDFANLLASTGFGALPKGNGSAAGGGSAVAGRSSNGSGSGSSPLTAGGRARTAGGSVGSRSGSQTLGNSTEFGGLLNHGRRMDNDHRENTEGDYGVGTYERDAFNRESGGGIIFANSGSSQGQSSVSEALGFLRKHASGLSEKMFEAIKGGGQESNAEIKALMSDAFVEYTKELAQSSSEELVKKIPCGSVLLVVGKLSYAFGQGAGEELLRVRSDLTQEYDETINSISLAGNGLSEQDIDKLQQLRMWQLRSVNNLTPIMVAGFKKMIDEASGMLAQKLQNKEHRLGQLLAEHKSTLSILAGEVAGSKAEDKPVEYFISSASKLIVNYFVDGLNDGSVVQRLEQEVDGIDNGHLHILGGLVQSLDDFTVPYQVKPGLQAAAIWHYKRLVANNQADLVKGGSTLDIDNGILTVPTSLYTRLRSIEVVDLPLPDSVYQLLIEYDACISAGSKELLLHGLQVVKTINGGQYSQSRELENAYNGHTYDIARRVQAAYLELSNQVKSIAQGDPTLAILAADENKRNDYLNKYNAVQAFYRSQLRVQGTEEAYLGSYQLMIGSALRVLANKYLDTSNYSNSL